MPDKTVSCVEAQAALDGFFDDEKDISMRDRDDALQLRPTYTPFYLEDEGFWGRP